jgi:hypothetical protein
MSGRRCRVTRRLPRYAARWKPRPTAGPRPDRPRHADRPGTGRGPDRDRPRTGPGQAADRQVCASAPDGQPLPQCVPLRLVQCR